MSAGLPRSAASSQAGPRDPEPAGSRSEEDRLRAFLRRAPKADVHRHLEGTVTAEWLAARGAGGRPTGGETSREVAARLRFDSLASFLALFRWVLAEHFRTPDDYVDALRYDAGRLELSGVRYAEITVSVGAMLFFGRPAGEILDALTEAADAIERSGGAQLRFIGDGVRQHGPEPLGRVLELLVRQPRERWPALGLGGLEESVPAREFAEVFQEARRVGLRADVHAGETGGAREVWEVLTELQPARLIHAVGAAEDATLLRELRTRRLPLALNLTSNVRTGAVAAAQAHPLRRFLRAGLVVSVNTDDPGLLGITLEGELELAVHALGLAQQEVEQVLLGGVECAFLPGSVRERLLHAWGGELEMLRRESGLEEEVLGSGPRLFQPRVDGA